MTIDIKDIYLGTPLKRYEYIRMQYDIIPDKIKEQYHLQAFKHNECVYFGVRQGMDGLPQVEKNAYDQFSKHLEPYGYKPVQQTSGLWTHETKNLSFILWVKNFVVLQTAPAKLYRFESDWSGKMYVKIHLKWNYEQGTVSLLLPGYISIVSNPLQ